MSNICESTLKAYGSPHLAERVRAMISPIFGPSLPDYNNPLLKSEPGNPPLAVVRIESQVVPPVSIVAELSRQEPGLVLELLYSNWASGVRGRRVYKGGDVTSETEEKFEIEAQRGDSANASQRENGPSGSRESEPVQPTVQDGESRAEEWEDAPFLDDGIASTQAAGDDKIGLCDYVSRCLDRGYSLRRKSLCSRLSADERDEDKQCFAAVDALKQVLSDTDRFYIEQLEEQCRLGCNRLECQIDLQNRLADCLEKFRFPFLRDLLDSEDEETLQRISHVLEKLP